MSMKLEKTILLLLLLGLHTTTFAQKSKIATVTIGTSIACDHCKKCESCAPRLETALYKIKGVKRVTVLDKKNEVVVVFNTSKTDVTTLKQAITQTGFDADEQKAVAEAYTKLDECCRQK